MIRVALSVLVILHGLVHLLYVGQSARYFELQPGMAWPDGAWAFSSLLGAETTRVLASALLITAAVGFVVGGAAMLLAQPWMQPVTIVVAIFSSIAYLLLWDGSFQHLDDKGAFGILINLAILAVLLIARR